jgi:streptogramin lyase
LTITKSRPATSNSSEAGPFARAVRLGLVFTIGAALSACGGGGASSIPSAADLQSVPVTVTVRIPKGGATAVASARSPRYISSAIQSIVFRLTAVTPASGGTYTGALNTNTVIPISYGSANCTADADGDKTCTATSMAPAPATDVWTIYTYGTVSPAVGTTVPLSVYVAFAAPVTVAGPNTLAVATWGVPATLAFSPAGGLGTLGTVATFTTSLQTKDASGATLIGGQSFSNAMGTAGNVTFSGCVTHLTPTPASITAATPSDLGAGGISVVWDGAGTLGTSMLCNATGPGGLSAAFAVTPAAVKEYPILTAASNPRGIAAGPDGNLWFVEYAGNKIGKMTPLGALTEYAIPTGGSATQEIAAGSDGNLWFVEITGNKIGQLTTDGAFTEFALPHGASQPNAICAGPDGNLWFTEAANAANKIGKVTTSGAITEYPITTANSNPNGITAGSDGNLWFTEYAANKIGKMTTSGAVTEYVIPTASSNPLGIAVGPDGNIWFTESNTNKIGNVTPSGTFTEYVIPTASSNPRGITAGPNGNLWFTEYSTNKIGRITRSGAFTEYTIPTAASNPVGITAGPDGHLWFTEWSGNNIGRF